MRQLQIILILAVLSLGSSLWAQTHPGEVVRTIACPSPCPTGIAAEGDRLWVVDRFTDKIYELDHASGKVRRELEAPCYQPKASSGWVPTCRILAMTNSIGWIPIRKR